MDIRATLNNLFSEAETKGGFDYICTLIRLEGLTFGVTDPLIDLWSTLQTDLGEIHNENFLSNYCALAGMSEVPFSLIANLINCIVGKSYNISPFHHLFTGQFPNIVKPNSSQMAQEVVSICKEISKPELAKIISEAYPEDLLSSCGQGTSDHISARLQTAFDKCRLFLISLLDIYYKERLKFQDQPRFYKLPGFRVLEYLVDKDYGLYGFQLHFSNGSSATFARYKDSTVCTNIEIGWELEGFFIGEIDELREEWRVGEKRLYEIGIPGRYNVLGEWKPLVYPGNPKPLQEEAFALTDDPDVQGSLFYMMCTGHRVIEFVVRTSIDLPIEKDVVKFGDKFHMWKCPPIVDAQTPSDNGNTLCLPQNIWIYDGWFELEAADPECIRSAIAGIGVGANRLAFAYNAPVHWCLKYRMEVNIEGCKTPSEEDLHILDAMLRDFPRTDDAIILDAAIDWYNRGRSSRNVFTQFLCYYIALESVAIAVWEGKADLGLNYHKESKKERKQKKLTCIQDMYDRIYTTDPAKFVQDAYFECVVALKEKTRRVAQVVFGPDHRYMKALFDKGEQGFLFLLT